MNDLKKELTAGLKSREDVSINVTPFKNRSESIKASSVRRPAIEAEFSVSDGTPAVAQTKKINPALQMPSSSMPSIAGPLDMMQQQTKILNAINSNHTARYTRTKQVKEEQFQEFLRQSYYELSGTIIRPLLNRPSVTGQFPFEILPEKLADDVRRISEATGWEPFSTQVTALGVLSIALWGRFVVRLGNGWDEPILTYLCVASPSGTMKSFFVKNLKAPLLAFRDEVQETFDMVGAEVKETGELMRVAIKKSQRKKIQQIVNADADDLNVFFEECQKIVASGLAAKKKLDAMQVGRPTILLDNISAKKIPHVMRDNGEVGNFFESEIGFFEDIAKDQALGARLLLKANCMEEFAYDTCRSEVRLLHAALNIIYVVQPEALKKIYMDRHLADLGVTPRFDIHFASEPEIDGLNELDESVLQDYKDIITAHLRRNYTQEQARPIFHITVSPEANDLIMDYKRGTLNSLKSGACKHMDSYIRKLSGKAVRWAALVHSYMNERPESLPISADTMRIGIEIAEQLARHADYAFRSDGLQACDLAQRVVGWIQDRRLNEFSSRELQRGLGTKVKMGTLEGALKLLARHNIIRIHQKPYGGLHCLVHPQAGRI